MGCLQDKQKRKQRKNVILICAAFIGIGTMAEGRPVDLTSLSIEELMHIEINLASRKAEKVVDVAAAAYVLTHEDIVKSGFTSLPDVLRLVPGLEVGSVDANKWAISARGYNNVYANKLLVLIDGRSVYNPLFSGVFWELQHIPLQDVEHIEVIRGPGGTLWGANAVNGIINIITKNSRKTQGGYVKLRSGTREKAAGTARWGGRLSPSLTYRAYVKGFEFAKSGTPSGDEVMDDWRMNRAGFRMDGTVDSDKEWILHGDAYLGRIGQTLRVSTPDYILTKDYATRVHGGYVAAGYRQSYAQDREIHVQSYMDVFRRKDKDLIGGGYATYDLDLQYRMPFYAHQLVAGVGYRITRDFYNNSDFLQFIPSRRTHRLIGFFVQDEFSVFHDKLSMQIGMKFEHDKFSGFHVQPNGRFLYKANAATRIWGAISRAIRAPARVDMDIQNVLYRGNPEFKAETLLAHEIGVRRRLGETLSVNGSVYYHDYDRLNTVEPEMSDNKKQGWFYGAEFSADWFISPGFKIRSGGSYIRIQMQLDEDSQDKRATEIEDESPAFQAFVNTTLELTASLVLNMNVKYVDKLDAPQVMADGYTALNLSCHYQILPWMTLSVAGQNLLQDVHDEFPAGWLPFATVGVERSAYGQILFTF